MSRRHQTRMIWSIELCLSLGANLATQDPRGCSPLHLAFRLQKVHLLSEILLRSHEKLVYPVDESGLWHFYIACVANDTDLVARLLTSEGVDVNSPVAFNFRWYNERQPFDFAKGSTPLHIAVITRNSKLAQLLLTHGANPLAKDDDSLSPVHRLLYDTHYRYEDEEKKLADALLSSFILRFTNDDVAPVTSCGLTYLHVVSDWNNEAAVKKLLNLGANINARITYQRQVNQKSGRFRFGDIQSEHSIGSLNFLAPYAGYTPLHLAMERGNDKILEILVQRGADIFARNSNGMALVYDILTSRFNSAKMIDPFVRALSCDATLQNRMLEDSGLTMLHVACAAMDADMIRNLCGQGLDVNARAHMDSPIWPGCTPLHVLMIKSKGNVGDIVNIINLLLDCGGDVTLANADQKTPLHEEFERFYLQGPRFANLLLRAQKDFSINPVSIKGVSHFHIACSCKEVAAVEKFLKYGADINLPINYFCEFYGGLTPIHLASVHHFQDLFTCLKKRGIDFNRATYYDFPIKQDPLYVASIDDCEKTVDILLQHGANLNTRDINGNTSLHVAVASEISQVAIWERLIQAGADLNVENLLGETPLEVLLSKQMTSKLVELLLRRGVRLNIYNSVNEGFIPEILLQHDRYHFWECLSEAMSNAPDVNYFDEMGRSLIHNIVSHGAGAFSVQDYIKFIGDCGMMGHGVDHADENGQTALHLAIEFRNSEAVLGLLDSGADINVLRRSDKATLILSEELQRYVPALNSTSLILEKLSVHVYKLKLYGIYVNSINQELYTRIHRNLSSCFDECKRLCLNEMKLAKITKIKPHRITLYDFLSEAGVVGSYARLPIIQRHDITDFFRNKGTRLHKHFPQLLGVIQLQYRKALARVALLEPAKDALSILMKLKFPDLCSEMVLRYLTNDDLKRLMESTNM